jgi:DeoR/GlpR family transcriptional regulator of sugar metabolism
MVRDRNAGLKTPAGRSARIALDISFEPRESAPNRNQAKFRNTQTHFRFGACPPVKPAVASEAVFAPERQEQIARMVVDAGRVRVTDLAAQFGVSPVTIRKDLLVLEGEARVVRTHGGAIAPRTSSRPEPAFEVRERLQRDEKWRIGAAAAALVEDGESIVFDASTTALYVARHLKDRPAWHQLTVITNSIRIALELAGHPGITVLMLGGRVRAEALSVVGPLGDGVFRRVNVQKAFVGAVGLTMEAGLSDAMEEEAQIKRSMVAAAREVYALVDHTKFGRTASATFCRADRLTAILTDERAPADMVAALRTMGVRVDLVTTGSDR